MRQLEMLDEPRRLHVVGMRQYEFLVLGGRGALLAELIRSQRPLDQRHRHRLALELAEHQPVAAGELRRRAVRADELVHHLAFGDIDGADGDLEAELLRGEEHGDRAVPDLADKGMGAAIAALRRIGERQEKPLVATRQALQAQIAVGRKVERLGGEVAGLPGGVARLLDETLGAQDLQHPGHRVGDGFGGPAPPAPAGFRRRARSRSGGANSRRSARVSGRRECP